MLIQQVEDTLVCTSRVDGLKHWCLRVVRDHKGARTVAVDPVGCRKGNWVFTVSGSAARYALPDPSTQTDLTICGIIDFWEGDEAATATAPSTVHLTPDTQHSFNAPAGQQENQDG